jgi:hypothetical protein
MNVLIKKVISNRDTPKRSAQEADRVAQCGEATVIVCENGG